MERGLGPLRLLSFSACCCSRPLLLAIRSGSCSHGGPSLPSPSWPGPAQYGPSPLPVLKFRRGRQRRGDASRRLNQSWSPLDASPPFKIRKTTAGLDSVRAASPFPLRRTSLDELRIDQRPPRPDCCGSGPRPGWRRARRPLLTTEHPSAPAFAIQAGDDGRMAGLNLPQLTSTFPGSAGEWTRLYASTTSRPSPTAILMRTPAGDGFPPRRPGL